MKKTFFLMLVLVLNSITLNAQECCPPPQNACVPSPALINCQLVNAGGCQMVNEAVIEDACFNNVEKILSRASHMNFLSSVTWNSIDDLFDDPNNTNESSYCNNLRFLRDANISFVAEAIQLLGQENNMIPSNGNTGNNNYLQAVRQLVCDINSVYDCAGLTRPFIQARIIEYVSDGSVIEGVPIPVCVIEAFMNDPGFNVNYYCEDGGDGIADIPLRPKTTLHFVKSNIVMSPEILTVDVNNNGEYDLQDGDTYVDLNGNNQYDGNSLQNFPDLTKIETAMWFYHNARIYMDLGVNAFSLGQVGQMAKAEKQAGYPAVANLLDKIRQCAESRNMDILISAEPVSDSKFYTTDPLTGKKHYLFDYLTIPNWPIEINTGQQDVEPFGCKPSDEFEIWEDEACSDFAFPAVPNFECILEELHGSDISGIGPNGCEYEAMPVISYFDFGFGCNFNDINGDGDRDPGENIISTPNPDAGSTYGFDDKNWFANIPEECKIKWFSEYFCNMKNAENRINMLIPGRIAANLWEQCYIFNGQAQFYYHIWNEPNFMNSVIQNLTPETNDWNLTYTNEFDPTCPQCSTSIVISQSPYVVIYETRIKNPIINFSVNPDCTTAYSWHIKKPDGSWLNYQKASSGSFIPDQEGYYTIYLNRDNKGLEGSNQNGITSNQTSKMIKVKFCDVYAQCISDILKRYYNFNYSCKPNGSHNVKLNFENESINGITLTANQGQILTTPIYNYQKSEIEFSYRSAKLPDSNNDIRDVMDINIVDSRYPYTARAIEVMDACIADEARISDVKEIGISKVEIYPNPTSGIINFKLEDLDDFVKKIEIFNLEGKKVLEFEEPKTLKSGSINTYNLLNGIYLIKGLTNKSKFEEKIIISK